MAVIVVLILASLGLAVAFLLAFVWAVRSGQFEDARTPAMRILTDDPASGRPAAARRPSPSPGQTKVTPA